MKKNFAKKLCVLTMAAALSASVTACGSKSTDTAATTVAETTAAATTVAETTAEATTEAESKEEKAVADGDTLTEDEYLDKTEEIGNAMTTVSTDAQTKLQALDPTDVEGAKKIITDMKTPFLEMAAVKAPEKYADAQAKYKSGCEAMAEYLDLVAEMAALGADGNQPSETEVKDLTAEITTLLQTVQTDLTEANALLIKAAAE